MQTREELIAKIRAYRERQREEAQSQHQTAAQHGVNYGSEHRSNNLRLLRAYFNETQESFRTLTGVSSQPQYSLIEKGEKILPESAAREIERNLDLPKYWFDRSNVTPLFLTQNELSLVNELRRMKPEVALKLAELVKLMSGRDS